MTRIILGVWLSVFSLGQVCLAEEKKDWDRIHLTQGFHYFKIDELPTLTEEEHFLLMSLESIANPSQHQVLLKENGAYYAFNTCDLNYWKWEGTEWQKMTDQKLIGYNCTPYFFLKENTPHVISGSGYWQNQTDIFVLDAKQRKAIFKSTLGQPEHYRGNLIFKGTDGIYSLFGHRFDVRLDLYTLELGGYYLDLSSNRWEKLKFNLSASLEKEFEFLNFNQVNNFFSHIETDRYGVMELHSVDVKKTFWVIVDKTTLEVYVKETPFLQLADSKWTQVIGDTIFQLGNNSTKANLISVEKVLESASLIGKIDVLESTEENGIFDRYYPVFVLIPLFLLVMGGLWIDFRSKKTKPVISETDDLEPTPIHSDLVTWLANLEPLSGKLLSQDQMDMFLGYSAIHNSDLRKVKRARAIKSINEHMHARIGQEVISRVRDAQDKRVISYQIHHLSKVKKETKVGQHA